MCMYIVSHLHFGVAHACTLARAAVVGQRPQRRGAAQTSRMVTVRKGRRHQTSVPPSDGEALVFALCPGARETAAIVRQSRPKEGGGPEDQRKVSPGLWSYKRAPARGDTSSGAGYSRATKMTATNRWLSHKEKTEWALRPIKQGNRFTSWSFTPIHTCVFHRRQNSSCSQPQSQSLSLLLSLFAMQRAHCKNEPACAFKAR
ncbi:hypothetical protein TRVL_04905 [Trypanosoma vivax]|nr:hypothetical protein TRVL_04905 [Trypanosoma vivax]